MNTKQNILDLALGKYDCKKSIVICDIDGTLSDLSHRLHYVVNVAEDEFWHSDWIGFFSEISKDSVRENTVTILRELMNAGHPVVIVTARPAQYRQETEDWLAKIFNDDGLPAYTALLMRETGNTEEDAVIKERIYETYLSYYPIHCVIDDRPRVVKMWKELGLTVIDVGPGQTKDF
jgi:hypothetical protein